ncbi:MAG: Cation transport regulator ChaB [Chlamydiae bacterium]|nr:Cation transport regulator ChaB [Chlamydiota bacterium]
MPKGKVTVPSTLSGHAAEIYRSAFSGAFEGTCDGEDSCAAKVAWSAVKEKFIKGEGDKWVAKSFDEIEGIEINGVPLPGSLHQSPFTAALTWIEAFQERYESTNDIAEASGAAWAALKERYAQDFESGTWVERDDVEAEQVSDEADEEVDALETETVETEPIHITRSARTQNQGRGDIVIDGLSLDEEVALFKSDYVNSQAACPEGMDPMAWADLPAMRRTVGGVIRQKWITRAYVKAVENYKEDGLTFYDNPSGSGEMIGIGTVRISEKSEPFTATGVLTRNSELSGFDPAHWLFRALGRGTLRSTTTAIRVPVNEVRFRGPILR